MIKWLVVHCARKSRLCFGVLHTDPHEVGAADKVRCMALAVTAISSVGLLDEAVIERVIAHTPFRKARNYLRLA